MALFGRGRLGVIATKWCRPRLLLGKRNLNGFSPDLRSKHLTDSSSGLSDKTQQSNDKSFLISAFWTPAGFLEKRDTEVVVKHWQKKERLLLKNTFRSE